MGLSFDHIILLPEIYPQNIYIYIYAKRLKPSTFLFIIAKKSESNPKIPPNYIYAKIVISFLSFVRS